MRGQGRELGAAIGMIQAGKARLGGMLLAEGQQGGGRQPVLARLHRRARQGPDAGAGPWRVWSAAGVTHVGAAIPFAAITPPQEATPPAACPYLTTFTEHQDSRSVMRVQGELDLGSQAHLRHAIAATLNRYNPRILVLDLSELSFIDCTGLRVIVWAQNCQAERGHKLILTKVQPIVRRVLHLASYDTILNLSAP